MSGTSQAPTPATEQPPATPQPLEDAAWKEAVAQFADQVALDEEADASMWQDLPADINQLADADELGDMLEALYKADLSDELQMQLTFACLVNGYVLAPCSTCMILLLMLQMRALKYLMRLTCRCSPLAGLMQLMMLLLWLTGCWVELCNHVFQQRR